MSPTLLIIGLILIIVAVSGCVGGGGIFGDMDTRMNGNLFCKDHGYDALAINATKMFCVRYGENETITHQRRVVELNDGSFAFSLSAGGE